MADWIHRTMIVPLALVPLAAALTAGLAGASGTGMFGCPLGAQPGGPQTHGMSTGLIDRSFADLLPLDEWDDEAGAYERAAPGQAAYIAQASQGAVSLAQANALLAAVIVTGDDWEATCARLGLVQVIGGA